MVLKAIWCKFTIATKKQYSCKPRKIALRSYSRPYLGKKQIAFLGRCFCRYVWSIALGRQCIQRHHRNLSMRGDNLLFRMLLKSCIPIAILHWRSVTFPVYEVLTTSDTSPSFCFLVTSPNLTLHLAPYRTSSSSVTIFITTSNARRLTCILGCATASQSSRRCWIGRRRRWQLRNEKLLGEYLS